MMRAARMARLIAGDADRFEAGVPRLAGSPHAVAQARLVAAGDDVDPGQEQIGIQCRFPIAHRFG